MRFSWFGEQEHKVYNYRPRFYDPEREALRKKLSEEGVPESELKKDDYVPGSHLRGAFRNGNYAKRKGESWVTGLVSLIGLILFAVILIMITKFYSLL